MTPPAEPPAHVADTSPSGRGALARLLDRARMQEGGLLVVILVLGLLLTVFSGTVRTPVFATAADGTQERVYVTNAAGESVPDTVEKNKFLNAQNLAQLAKDTSFIAIMAVGMSVVIIAGGIDLSVGAIYALASVLGAMALHSFGPGGDHATVAPWLGVGLGAAVCVGVAALCGLINGGLIVALRVHPFIITLGAMAILRGIAFVTTKGQSIGGFPPAFRELVRYEVGNGLSLVPLAVMLVVTIAGGIFLARLAAGRRVYAIGGNELAARFSGIRVERVKLGVYLLSGASAGIAALLALGYYGAATSGDGQGYELNVIAAAVVGGASLTGGKGSALGAVLGALVIQMINSGIVILGIDQNYSQIIIGAVVIAAVVLDNLNTWLARRRPAAHA
jgi:ribose/xylose/arabinose/galactoside ABC-type transport system permease subunit